MKVRDGPALHDGIPWKEEPDKKNVGKENQHVLRILKRIVQKGMLVITGIRRGLACSGVSARSLSHSVNRLGWEQRNETIMWWSPKHWITPKLRIKSRHLNPTRSDTSKGVSYSSDIKCAENREKMSRRSDWLASQNDW